jgi:hypothetical protein
VAGFVLAMWAVDGKLYEKDVPRDLTEEEIADRFWKRPTIECDRPPWTLVTRHVVAFRIEGE